MSAGSSSPVQTAAGITLRDLTVRVGSRTLLESTSADFPAGGVTLIVGPSGSGKSVLLRVLAGLIDPSDNDSGSPFAVSGSLLIGDHDILDGSVKGARGPSPTGIVFQSFALFDELSATANVQFALDHRRASNGSAAPAGLDPASLLSELQVPARTPVNLLSGGQRQRLAIARTLAYDPPVVIYDEPTSGLDPANAGRVARRLREAGERHGKTSVVVTHDYANLLGIADVVYLLDPTLRRLVRIERGELDSLGARLEAAAPAVEPLPVETASVWRRGQTTLAGALETSGRALERLAFGAVHLLPLWPSPRWGLRYLVHYLKLLASPSAWVYFGAAGLIAGFVSTHFIFKFLPYKQHTLPLISEELLNGLGFALYRIIVPVLVTILLAARCGAAVASDIGNRVYTHQTEALRSMGVRPERYLMTNVLLAFLLATPLLVGLGFLVARWTSLAVYVYSFPLEGPSYWHSHFHRDLCIPGEFLYRGSGWLVLKSLLSGFGVGLIAYHIGRRPKSSGVEVSRGITATIIWATLFVLLVHFAFAFVEF